MQPRVAKTYSVHLCLRYLHVHICSSSKVGSYGPLGRCCLTGHKQLNRVRSKSVGTDDCKSENAATSVSLDGTEQNFVLGEAGPI